MSQDNRPEIPQYIADEITTRSRRVCALCWALKQDGRDKEGQIAHINGKRDDNRSNNLTWLCLDHHNRHDGRMKQTRGFSIKELAYYKELVEQAVVEARLPLADHAYSSCCIRATLVMAFLHDLNDPKSGSLFEVVAQFVNEGERSSGIKEAYLQRGGVRLGAFASSVGGAGKHKAFLATEYLQLESHQVVESGRSNKWAACFIFTPPEAEALAREAEHLDPPLQAVFEPVLGPPIILDLHRFDVNPDGIYPVRTVATGVWVDGPMHDAPRPGSPEWDREKVQNSATWRRGLSS